MNWLINQTFFNKKIHLKKYSMQKTFYVIVLVAVLLQACRSKNENNTTVDSTNPLLSNIDSTVNPADDFFYFANGNWLKNNPIPETENYNGIFKMVRDSINNIVKEICEKNSKDSNKVKGSDEQKIGDFYLSAMDTATLDKLGFKPLEQMLGKINSLKSKTDLPMLVADLHSYGTSVFFGIYVGRDEKNSKQNSISFYQSGLGLPERDYYFNSDAMTKSIRAEYLKYATAIFDLLKVKNAESCAKSIIEIEEKLASASRRMEDLRDPYLNYNKMSSKVFFEKNKIFNYEIYLKNIGLLKVDSIIIGQPDFFKSLAEIFKNESIENIRSYLLFHLADNYADYLSKPFRDLSFRFHETVMSGTKKQKPRWKESVELTNSVLGEQIGKVFVKEYLPKNTKEKFKEIGDNIVSVFREHLLQLDWMSEATKQKALVKLSTINMKLGYPDKWRDYSLLNIYPDSLCVNIINTEKHEFKYMINKYGKPVDKSEWVMKPQTYNAYYDATLNEFVIPGCNIIVPGYKGMPPDAVLYGIIGGGTFGHEITHGFDDQGSKFDEYGNLNNWWSKEDEEKFNKKTKALVEQYNNYVVLDSMHVRGEATLGENIADLGGCIMGYEAFMKTENAKKKVGETGKFTPAQEYFLGFAYGWMVQKTNQGMAKQIMTDVHSPAQFRVNGPMSNMKEFYDAFNVKESNKMYRNVENRIKIW